MHRQLLAAFALTALLSSPLAAQPPKNPAIDTAFITTDMVAAFVAFPKRALNAPELELLPTEMLSAGGLMELGFDPLELEQVLAVVGVPDPAPKFGAVLRFAKPIDKDKVFAKPLAKNQPATSGGKAYRKASSSQDLSLYVADDRTVLLGDDATLVRMMAAPRGDSPLIRLLKGADTSSDVLFMASVDGFRDWLIKEIAKDPPELPPELADLKRVPELLSTVEARFNLRSGLKNELTLKGRDEKSAVELAKIVDSSLEFGRKQFLANMQTAPGDPNDPVNMAMARYGKRLTEHYLTAFRPTRQGDRLTLSATSDLGAAQIAVMAGLLLPAVQSARSAAQRAQATNELKQIALGMINFHDLHRKFPSRAIVDKQGKPLLSWRVQILPYLDQQALYDKFKLDEPWNSPHNRELIRFMPAIYGAANPEGKTSMLVPVAKGTIFGGTEGVTFAKIKDGSSNTILAVEADAARAVVWTRPVDLEVDLDKPAAGLGTLRPGGFNVVFADGHVAFLKNTLPPATLRALFTHDAGDEASLDLE